MFVLCTYCLVSDVIELKKKDVNYRLTLNRTVTCVEFIIGIWFSKQL